MSEFSLEWNPNVGTIKCMWLGVGFFTPGSSGTERSEKVNLGITTLLAMSILLLMVSDQMPTTSNFVPLIGWFFLLIIAIISLGTFLTSVIILIQQRAHNGRPVPIWAKNLFLIWLPKWIFMSPPANLSYLEDKNKQHDAAFANVQEKFGKDIVGEPIKRQLWVNKSGNSTTTSAAHREKRLKKDCPTLESSRPDLRIMIRLSEMQKSINNISAKLESNDEDELIEAEWEYMAAVLDRFFLFVFALSTLMLTAMLLIIGSSAMQD